MIACDSLTLSLLRGQRDELGAKYQLVKQAADAREGWEAVYESSLHACMHGANCMQGRDCQVGPSGLGQWHWSPTSLLFDWQADGCWHHTTDICAR